MSGDELSMYREQLTLVTAQVARVVRERDEALAKLAAMSSSLTQASTSIVPDVMAAIEKKVAVLENQLASRQEDLKLRVEESDALIAQLKIVEAENVAYKKQVATLTHENETQFTSLARLGSLNVELRTAAETARAAQSAAELELYKVQHREGASAAEAARAKRDAALARVKEGEARIQELEALLLKSQAEQANKSAEVNSPKENVSIEAVDYEARIQTLLQDNTALNTALTQAGATALEYKQERDKARARLQELEAQGESLKNAPNSPQNEKSDVTPGPVVVGAKFQRQRKKKTETLVVERIDKSQVFCSVLGTPNSGNWYHIDVISALPALPTQS